MHLATTRSDVVIAGGGFAGLSLASALAREGLTVTVLEAADGMSSFRGELLHPSGLKGLTEVGLAEPLWESGAVSIGGFAAFSSPLDSLTTGATPGAVLLPYPTGRGAGFDHPAALTGFRRQLEQLPGVTVHRRVRAEDLLWERSRVVGLRGDDGRDHRAPIVIAADGRHSKLRDRLGISTQSALLSYTLAPALAGASLPLAGTGHVFVGAPGPILAYPFGARQVRMCIDIPLGVTRGRESILSYVREHYAPHVPEPLRSEMVAALACGQFRSSANHAVYTQACAVPGAALIGDAGGCSHPLTAAGMTNALHDVVTLLGCLRRHGLTDDALVAYQRRRYGFIRAREVFAQALFEVLRGGGSGPRALRAGVFRYWRDSARARRVSTAILAGEESRASVFLGEYARVALAAGQELRGGARALQPHAVAVPTASVLRTAGLCLGSAVRQKLSASALGRTRQLRGGRPATLVRPLGRLRGWLGPAH